MEEQEVKRLSFDVEELNIKVEGLKTNVGEVMSPQAHSL